MRAKFINEGVYSIKKVEDNKLKVIADDLNRELVKGKREDHTNVHGTKTVMQHYSIGDVSIVVKTTKVPGMGADNAEVWVLDKTDLKKGVRFTGMDGYSGLIDFIAGELGDSDGAPDVSEEPEEGVYTDAKLKKLLQDLKADNLKFSDDEAFDMARNVLDMEPGLESFIRSSQRVEDPLSWLADRI